MKQQRPFYLIFLSGSFKIILVLAGLTSLQACSKKDDATPPDTATVPVAVTKTNAMKIYMHYMPWFQAKPYSTFWGSHWTMKNKNPEVVDENGKRQIASHYYPLIGPYDSSDPDVIDYHLLLMKYAGVDGLLIDWYGSHGKLDYGVNLVNTNNLIARTDETGSEFAVVYEDYVAENTAPLAGGSAVTAAQQDIAYAQKNYFSNKLHIRIDNRPLLMTFGPRYFKTPAQWNQILSVASPKPYFLPLWGASGYVGDAATGEFSWVDFNSSFNGLKGFYANSQLKGFDFIVGSAFPRFHDFYEEGGTGTSYGYVDSNNGQTFESTLALAAERKQKYLQLITWNDFGEGTVIEPTLEDQFTFLESLQTFTGVSYGHDELELIYHYYLKKKKYPNDSAVQEKLKSAFTALVTLKVSEAKVLIEAVPD